MDEQERLDKLVHWWHDNRRDLLVACMSGNAYANRFDVAIVQAIQSPADATLTAAENALVELEADWEGK